MDAGRTDLFSLAERRLAWADRRQALLAQNIANADTPGFVPKDAAPFARTLSRAIAAGTLSRTQPNHLAATPANLADTQPQPRERAPDGNAVALDEQLTKVADTETTQTLVTAIYRKYLTLFGLALGRSA